MRTGRPVPPLSLTDDERETLQQWARRPKTSQALAQRARIILACAQGETNTTVAERLRVTKQTVGKWRTRFLIKRLDGLLDEPRPGTPRRLSDLEVERVLTMTLESTPKNATHWSQPLAGGGLRPESEQCPARVARVCIGPAPQRDFQTFPGSAVHR